MNVTWTIVISLVASIIGGIFSGLIITRKIAHDNKRLSANQIYEDYKWMYGAVFLSLFEDLESLGFKGNNIIPLGADVDGSVTKNLLNNLREWLRTSAIKALSKRKDDELIGRMVHLLDDVLDRDSGIKNFLVKYPTQVSHFYRIYEISSMVDLLRHDVDNLGSVDNPRPLRQSVIDSYLFILDIIEELANVFVDIEYYRKARPWTWRIFVTKVRN